MHIDKTGNQMQPLRIDHFLGGGKGSIRSQRDNPLAFHGDAALERIAGRNNRRVVHHQVGHLSVHPNASVMP